MREKIPKRPIPDRSSLLGISYNAQETKNDEQIEKVIKFLKLNYRKDLIEFIIHTKKTAKSPAYKKDRTKYAYILDLLHTTGLYLLVIAIGFELYFQLRL